MSTADGDQDDGEWIRANDSYTPNKDFGNLELPFRAGDLLKLTGQPAPEGWLHGENSKGKQGLIPADYFDESSGDEDEDDEEANDGSMKQAGSPAAGAPGPAQAYFHRRLAR